MPGMQHGSTCRMPTATEMRNPAFEPCRDTREPEPGRPGGQGQSRPGGVTMTQRTHSFAPSGATRPHAEGASAVPAGGRRGCAARRDRPNLERGHMSISLLAIVAACAVAAGKAAHAELRFATAATGATPPVNDICSAAAARQANPAPACASAHAHRSRHFRRVLSRRSLPPPNFQNERRPTPVTCRSRCIPQGVRIFSSQAIHSSKDISMKNFSKPRKRIHSHRHPDAAPVGTCKRGHIGRADKNPPSRWSTAPSPNRPAGTTWHATFVRAAPALSRPPIRFAA